ncbi:putative transposase domain protein [Clostridioides difficile DA00165]|nr:putative transposase domain protein [Clostridioides difficile DA00165]
MLSSDNMERKIYRNFIRIPFGEIKGKLEYLCKIKNINFIRQEESYTSKSELMIFYLISMWTML